MFACSLQGLNLITSQREKERSGERGRERGSGKEGGREKGEEGREGGGTEGGTHTHWGGEGREGAREYSKVFKSRVHLTPMKPAGFPKEEPRNLYFVPWV